MILDWSPRLNVMDFLPSLSVYDARISLSPVASHPLSGLTPGDTDHGWHVSRNLRKPLNHLDFLREKEMITTRLNLHNVHSSAELFDPNYDILARHQSRDISTEDAISHFAAQCRLSVNELTAQLRDYATIRHMEFHPTDVCNLACRGCTYGHDDPELKPLPINFPFHEIQKIAQLQPRSLVLIGGGEPTLYKDGIHRFPEMVQEVVRTNPDIQLALVTNGTHRPPGDWPDRFAWIRVSLDAASASTYENFRRKPMFDRVVKNFLSYLDHDVPYVGVSFLFARTNVHDYAAVARFIYDLVKRENPDALRKVNIQYRPLRRDPYHYDRPFTESILPEQIAAAVEEVRQLADSSPEMSTFLRDQTNVTGILGGNSHPPHEFSRCYYSQTFCIVRASGELRPCFIRVAEPDFVLGNIQSDPLEVIALNTLYVAARRKPHCDAHGCRQCHVNYTFEQGLNGTLLPSTSPAVQSDPMF